MIGVKLRVVPVDGEPYLVAPGLPAVIAAERHFAKPFTKLFGDGIGLEPIAYLAWQQTQRDGRVVKPFDEWVEEIGAVEAEDNTGPLASST